MTTTTLSVYDIYEYKTTDAELKAALRENPASFNLALSSFKSEQRNLSREYNNGDALCYPPDWYDTYVYPYDVAISRLEDIIDEESCDDSEDDWY